MQIVIDIPKEIYNSACATNNVWDMRMAGFVCSAIANGTPLPKGHGRIVDISQIEYLKAIHEAKYGRIPWSEAIKQIKNSAPTIIEADKESEEQL